MTTSIRLPHGHGTATERGNARCLDHHNTREQRRRAVLYVCGHAQDVDDARLLLEALGLEAKEGR